MPVLAKCEHLNPGGSVKDRIALAIVDDAERRGVLAAGRHADRGDRRQHGPRPRARRGAARLPARLRSPGEDVDRQAQCAEGGGRRGHRHAERAAVRPRTTSRTSRGASPRSAGGSSRTSSATPRTPRSTSRRPAPRSSADRGAHRRVRGRRRHGRHDHRRRTLPEAKQPRTCASCSRTRSARASRTG